MTDAMGDELPHIKTHLEYEQAILYCRSWVEERKWLAANKVNFNNFEEEQRFQEVVKKYNLFERAKAKHLSSVINKIATIRTLEIINNKTKEQRRSIRDLKLEKIKQIFNNPKVIAKTKTRSTSKKLTSIREVEES